MLATAASFELAPSAAEVSGCILGAGALELKASSAEFSGVSSGGTFTSDAAAGIASRSASSRPVSGGESRSTRRTACLGSGSRRESCVSDEHMGSGAASFSPAPAGESFRTRRTGIAAGRAIAFTSGEHGREANGITMAISA